MPQFLPYAVLQYGSQAVAVLIVVAGVFLDLRKGARKKSGIQVVRLSDDVAHVLVRHLIRCNATRVAGLAAIT